MSDETTNTPEETPAPEGDAAAETPAPAPAEEPKAEAPKADEPKAESAAEPAADAAPATGDAAADAGEPVEQEAAPEPSPVDQGPTPWPADKEKNGYIWGTGRRKSSVARVRLRPGSGQFMVNGRPWDEYFTSARGRGLAVVALDDTKRRENYDIFVNTAGGGNVGQAGAVLLGIARCLKMAEPLLEPTLREHGHLTRDSRQKERKKYGRRGARRGFQFSKR
jgi:small subunit ribosomal protein S9